MTASTQNLLIIGTPTKTRYGCCFVLTFASETKDDCEAPVGKRAESAGYWGAAWFLRVKESRSPNRRRRPRGLQLKPTILFPDPGQYATFGTHYTTYARPYAPRPAFKPSRPRNSQRWGRRALLFKCAA